MITRLTNDLESSYNRTARLFGNAYAYMAIVHPEGTTAAPFGIGIAFKNEPGRIDIEYVATHGSDFQEMMDYAFDLNDHIGLTENEASAILASTMRGKSVKT